MDLAYDHIQETAFGHKEESEGELQSSLNADLQEAYKAISSSTWGAKIGGFLGNVVKQGETVYREAQQELTAVGEEATKGFSDLRESILNRTRSLSLTLSPDVAAKEEREVKEKDGQTTPTRPSTAKPDEQESVLSILRTEASKRLKRIQHAEDAADEALLKFGVNVRDFLRDAIRIAPPVACGGTGGAILFESKDAHGKRVIHASRYDAQLHLIHTSVESFSADPTSDEFAPWAAAFRVDDMTATISADLVASPELRATMEKLVPDKVPYAEFWKRYYFLRHGIETAETRRRDLLKAASAEVDVGWDDDSDNDTEGKVGDAAATKEADEQEAPSTASSTNTIHPPEQHKTQQPSVTATAAAAVAAPDQAIPAPKLLSSPREARKSNDERSQADSEASYDLVGAASANPSHAPNSPKDAKTGDDSDEEWE